MATETRRAMTRDEEVEILVASDMSKAAAEEFLAQRDMIAGGDVDDSIDI